MNFIEKTGKSTRNLVGLLSSIPICPILLLSMVSSAAADGGEGNELGANRQPAAGCLQCPAYPIFACWLRRQCPTMTDTRCVIGLPGDVPSPPGLLNCATVDDLPSAHLQLISAEQMLQMVKYRDPTGRPWCLLSLFYSPDCVFSAKVANSVFRVAKFYPKLRVVAVDVSQGVKGTESLISQYGIASTPVIALWQDGFPRFRLYDDYTRPDTLVQVIGRQTDLAPRGRGDGEGEEEDNARGSADNEPGRAEWLARFKYLQQDLGFDWYLLAALITCAVNVAYFALTSAKGFAFLQQHFPSLFQLIPI